MQEEVYELYPNGIIGDKTEKPTITLFKPYIKTGNGAILIFAGGAYMGRCVWEGEAYAQYFRSLGISAFVVDYRCAPAHFPDELLDARTAVRFVRKNAEKFGIDEDKIAVIGSSAGGHLCALLSTYRGKLEKEELTDNFLVDYLPSAQILCYPVISTEQLIIHEDSFKFLLGERYKEKDLYSPELLVNESTPKAFIWHTAEDTCVNVINSYKYAICLKEHNIPTELHVFPVGNHGGNLENDNVLARQWKTLLENWLRFYHFL